MDKFKGITIKIDGETTGLTKALKETNSEIKRTKSNLRDVENALKIDPKNVELLKAKQNALNEAIKETEKKLKLEQDAAKNAKEQLDLGNITQSEYDALQAEIVKTTDELSNLRDKAESAKQAVSDMEDKMSVKMQAAGAHIKEVGNNMSELGEKVTGVGDKVSALGGKMTATITMPTRW